MKKRLVAILLATGMILSCLAGCGDADDKSKESQSANTPDTGKQSEVASSQEPESKYPEYLNMDSFAPVIKDEYEDDITLNMVIVQSAEAAKWDDQWISKYLSEKYNLNFKVESILTTAVADRKQILMNGGQLPDIMIGLNFKTTEVVQYGSTEGLLLAMDEYISEELTPGLWYWLYGEGSHTGAREIVTANDGHIYTLPRINEASNAGLVTKSFINEKLMNEVGVTEFPDTLDEFDDLMYALKEEYDADGVGGKNFYPFGGGLGASPSGYYILNALGYNTHEPYGERASLRNGEVVIPAYDIEVFQEYLKLMNRWYNDKIINDNYVTITANEVKQQVLDNQTATYNNAPYVAGIDTWTDWRVLSPLTSDWNDTKFWFPGNPVSQGNFAISADTKYPELCLRFADLFYNLEDNPTVLNAGPVMADNLYGFEPVAVYDEETQELINNPDIKGGADSYTYRIEKCVGLELNFGAFATDLAIERYRSVLTEVEGWVFAEEEEEDDPKEMGGDDHYRWSTEQYLMEYITTKYPGVYYVDEETSVKITDLESVIRPHIRQSVGEFITGKREITDDELKKFQKELEALEIKELLQIYTDIYANYKANLE